MTVAVRGNARKESDMGSSASEARSSAQSAGLRLWKEGKGLAPSVNDTSERVTGKRGRASR